MTRKIVKRSTSFGVDACPSLSAEGEMADLWESISGRDLPLARKHLERGADVNYSQGGQSCLMRAVSRRKEALVSLLLEQPGIDVIARDDDDQTALHMATGSFGTPAIIRLLLDFPGIDREAKDGQVFTPLMRSIIFGTSAGIILLCYKLANNLVRSCVLGGLLIYFR